MILSKKYQEDGSVNQQAGSPPYQVAILLASIASHARSKNMNSKTIPIIARMGNFFRPAQIIPRRPYGLSSAVNCCIY